MAKKAIKWVAPEKSPAHQILRAQIAAAGLSVDALREMLWGINAHSYLVAFPRICENLERILTAISASWRTDENPQGHTVLDSWRLADWLPLTRWIVAHRQQLADEIGSLFDLAPSKSKKRHPVLSKGVTRHPLFATLWNRHQDPQRQERYLLLQGHLLVAHVAALRGQHKDHLAESYSAYEQYGSKKEWKALPNSPYQAALAVRYFSNMDFGQEELLDQYPVHLAPSDFVRALTAVSPRNDWRMLRRHKGLTDFLWKVATNQWRRGAGTGRGEGARGKWIDGHVELDGNVLVQKNVLGDSEDPDADWGEQEVATYCGGTAETRQELLDIDDHPGEDSEDEDLFWTDFDGEDGQQDRTRTPGDSVAASKAQIKHVDMAHQLLPWAYRNLSDGEARALNENLEHRMIDLLFLKKRSASEELRFELLALAQVMLCTGSSLERARHLKVFFEGTPNEDAELALFVDPASEQAAPWCLRSRWRLRALEPEYRQQQSPVAGQDRLRQDYLFLPNADNGSITRFLIVQNSVLQSARGRERPLEPVAGSDRRQPLRCFPRTIRWYRKELRKLLAEIDPTGRLTETKISGWLFSRLAKQSGGDVAAASLVTGQRHPLAYVRSYYATPEISQLQSSYRQAVRGLSPTYPDLASESIPSSGHVGSRLCPTLAAVQTAVQRLQEEIEAAAGYSKNPDWIRYHNLYSFYTLCAFSYTTGVRGIRIPYLSLAEVDAVTGFARLTDKDSGSNYKTRLVWIPSGLRKQMRYYGRHLEAVRLTAQGSPEVLEQPCFLLESGEHVNAREQVLMARPKTLRPVMKEFLPFPVNVHRRFMRTELLSRQCPPEIVDTWMGHWHRGEEPWGEHSCFSYADYQQELEKYLLPLLTELGFRPLRSCRA